MTYDPFNVLSLPIPNQSNMSITFKYIPSGYGPLDCEHIEFSLVINEFMTVFELKKRLTDYFSQVYYVQHPEKKTEWLQPFISVYKIEKDNESSNSLSIKGDDKFIKNLLPPGFQLLAHEREPFLRINFFNGDKMKDFVLIEVSQYHYRTNYVLFSYQ